MTAWVVEHGYVAEGREVVAVSFPPRAGIPRLGFKESREEPHRHLKALGITETFSRVRPATAEEMACRPSKSDAASSNLA